MLTIKPTGRFSRDVRRCRKRGLPLEELNAVINQLASSAPLPQRCHDHALTGPFEGYRECHVRPDWLLIYRVYHDELILVLSRTGTHADLFDL